MIKSIFKIKKYIFIWLLLISFSFDLNKGIFLSSINVFASNGVIISVSPIQNSSLDNEIQQLSINLNTNNIAIKGLEFTLVYNPSEIEVLSDSTVYSSYFDQYIKNFKNGSINIIALRDINKPGLIISKDIITFNIKPKIATSNISAYFSVAKYIDAKTMEVVDIQNKQVNYNINIGSIKNVYFNFNNSVVNVFFDHNKIDTKGFDIYRKSKDDNDFVKLNSVLFLNKSYVDQNIKINSIYKYKLKVTSNIYGLTKETQEYTVLIPLKDIPQPIVHVNENDKVEISTNLNNIENVSKYYIYRSEDDKNYTKIAEANVDEKYIDKNIIVGKSYYYKIKLLSSLDNSLSQYSLPVNVIAKYRAFNNNTVSLINGIPVLSWPVVNNAVAYEIYRSDNLEPFKKIATTNNNNFVDNNIRDRMYYRYYIRALYQDNSLSDPSNEAIIETRLTKLSAPVLKNNNENILNISYENVDTFVPKAYKVYKMINMLQNQMIYDGVNTTINDDKISENNTYYYSVSYISPFTERESEVSDLSSIFITSKEIIKNIVATNITSDSITIQWDKPVSEVSKYKVYRSNYMNYGYKSYETSINTFTDTGLNPNTTYYYKVSFVSKDADEESIVSPPISVTTKDLDKKLNDVYNNLFNEPTNNDNKKNDSKNNDEKKSKEDDKNNLLKKDILDDKVKNDDFNLNNNFNDVNNIQDKSIVSNINSQSIMQDLGCYNVLQSKDLLSVKGIKAWMNIDSDKDGIPNVTEIKNNTDLFSYENKEVKYNLELMKEMISTDDYLDKDNDKVNDRLEKFLNMNSSSKDTDNDGFDDFTELMCTMSSPLSKEKDLEKFKKGNMDSDNDGLSDELEYIYGTDPYNPDTDGDGFSDGEEVLTYKTNPLDPKSNPKNQKIKKVTNEIDGKILTNDSSPTIQGIASPDTLIKVIAKDKDGKEIDLGTVTTDENGNFILDSNIDLENGDYEIIFKEIIDGKEVIYRIKTKLIINKDLEIPTPVVKYIDDQYVLDKLLDTGAVIKVSTLRPLVRGNTYFGSKVIAIWQSVIYNSAILADSQFGYFEIRPPKPLDLGSHTVTLYSVTPDGYQSKAVKIRLLIENNKIVNLEEIKNDLLENDNNLNVLSNINKNIKNFLQTNLFENLGIEPIFIDYLIIIFIPILILLLIYIGYLIYKIFIKKYKKNT